MYLKSKLIIAMVIGVAVTSNLIVNTEAFCSLEKMKTFAIEACEHMADEPREKRDVSMQNKMLNTIGHPKSKRLSGYGVRRSNYPPGGYLKVGAYHYEKLSTLQVHPMYKLHHGKHKHLDMVDGVRHKRDGSMSHNYLSYCCYNRCDGDFFC